MSELPIKNLFASRLKAAREALGVSQAELGVRMGIPEDVASTRVNRYERAVHAPDLETAEKISVALGVPFPALVSRDDDLALLIACYCELPKAKKQAMLTNIKRELGLKKANVVKGKLQRSTPAVNASVESNKKRF